MSTNYVTDGLLAYFDPGITTCYPGSGTTLTSIAGTSGITASLPNGGSYNTEGTIRLTNTSGTATSNTQSLQLQSLTGFRTISFWIRIESTNNAIWRYLLDARTGATSGWIANNTSSGVGNDWLNGTMYINNVPTTITTTSVPSIFNTKGWKHVTVVGNSALTDNITLFGNNGGSEATDCSFGPIWVYNKVLSAQENEQNYMYYYSSVGNVINPTNAYPQFPLTANSSSGCVAKASSVWNNDANYQPWKAFNDFDNDYTSNVDFWHSELNYNGTTGSYTGGSTTLVSGVSYSGDWLQIQLPTAIRLYAFLITPRRDVGGAGFRVPLNFVIAASNDESNWTLVFSSTNTSWTATTEYPRIFQTATPTDVFTYYRMIVQSISSTPNNDNRNSVQITEWRLISDAIAYPHFAMTNDASNGYVATASSVADDGSTRFLAWKAFNYNTTPGIIGENFWNSAGNTYNALGVYAGTVSTLVDNTNYLGEWLQIQLPAAISIESFLIVPRYDQGIVNWLIPYSFVLAASNDGTTWTAIYTASGINYVNEKARPFFLDTVSKMYRFFRLIVRSVPNYNNAPITVAINEFRLIRPTPVTAVAGGLGNAHSLAFSSNEINWTGAGGLNIFSSHPHDFVYNNSLKRWVAVGGGTNTLAYSEDGMIWKGLGNNIFTVGIGVACNQLSASNTLFVASGEHSTQQNSLAYSTDGMTWVVVPKTAGANGSGGGILITAFEVAYSTTGTWIAVGHNEPNTPRNTIIRSTDGKNWTNIGATPLVRNGYSSGYCVATNNNNFWVVGGGNDGNGKSIVYSEDDGQTWTASSSSNLFGNFCFGVAWKPGTNYWVAVGRGDASGNCIATSTDGKVWTGRGKPSGMNLARRVWWTGRYWLVAGEQSSGGNALAFSTDGINWSVTSGTSLFTQYAMSIGSVFNGKSNQTLNFRAMIKSLTDSAFVPTVSTDATPEYNAITWSLSDNSGAVATTDGNTISLVGTGTVDVTVTQAANDLYNAASATATLKVLVPNAYPAVPVVPNYGYLSFARESSDHMVAPSTTFNMSTNGGMTAIARFRFTGNSASNEPVFDFGGSLRLARNGITSQLTIQTPTASATAGTIVQNDWTTVVARSTASLNTLDLFQNGLRVATTNLTGSLSNATLTNNYIARSSSNVYANLDLAGLIVFDRALTNNEIETCEKIIRGTLPVTSLPYTPLYTVLGKQLSLVNNQPVIFWGRFNLNNLSLAGNMPIYNSTGYVSFNRTTNQYLQAPTTTFNISTNGGFTAVCRVRFTGTAGDSERVFDFGNGQSNNNILFSHTTSGAVYFNIFNGSSSASTQSANNIISQDTWYFFACRYIKSSGVFQIYQNGSLVASTSVSTRNDRSLSINYIGRSHWSVDPYVNMDLAGLLVYDRALSDSDITICRDILEGTASASSIPTGTGTPVYVLLPGQLSTPLSSNIHTCGDFAQYTVANQPTYQLNNEYLSFNRSNNQFMSAPSTTFSLSGFTAIARVRFTELVTQRIFDFGNGEANNNLHMGLRVEGVFRCNLYQNSTSNALNSTTGTGVLNTWTTLVCRYSSTNNLLELFVNDLTSANASLTTSSTLTSRTLSNNYIGRSNWVGDPYSNMDLAGLLVYDRVLTTPEMTTCANIILNTVSPNQLPATPVYTLLPHQLYTVTELSTGRSISSCGSFSQATSSAQPKYYNDFAKSGYNTTSSSLYSDEQSFAAFDYNDVDYSSGSGNYWHSGLFYNASNGSYIGTASTAVVGSSSISGEWLQIQLPSQLRLVSFVLTPRRDADFTNRSPINFTIVASNDATNWYNIYSSTNTVWSTEYPRIFTLANSTTNTYSYFRLIIQSVGSGNSVQLTEWRLFGSLVAFPPTAMTSNTSSSNEYNVSASSELTGGNNPAWKAFDNLDIDYTSPNVNYWSSNGGYNNSTGVYTGAQTTSVSGSNQSGEWLQIQLPIRVRMDGFILTPRRDTASISNAPNNFIIAGSNDGTTWTSVYTSSTTTWTDENPRIFTLASPLSSTYNRYRLIVITTQGTSKDNVQITEWRLLTNTEYNTFAGGEGETHTLACSSDGVRWMGLGKGIFTSYVHDIAYGQNKWVAVGAGTNTIAYSSDGLNWTGLGTGSTVFATLGTSVAYNGTRWIASGDESSALTRSTDATSWSKTGISQLLNSVYGIAWNSTLARWVSVGTDYTTSSAGTRSIQYSNNADGTTWTAASNNPFSGSKNAYCIATGTLPVVLGGTSRWVAGAGSTSRTVSYPTVALTTNSSSNCVASASSQFNESGTGIFHEAWRAFDNATNTFWHSVGSYNSSGTYTGGTSTTADNNISYSGEWIQIQLPTAIRLGACIILPRQDQPNLFLYSVRSPRDFVIVGSNDGSTWTTVFSATGTTWSDTSAKLFDLSSAYTPFRFYRLIARSSGAGQYAESIQIARWQLLPSAEGYPLLNMTSNVLPSGTASSSSEHHSGLFPPWKAFDGDRTTYWHCANSLYDSATGLYLDSSTNTTTADSNPSITLRGEWLQIIMPSTRIFAFSIIPRPDIGYGTRAPRNFTVVASTNGSTWTRVFTTTNAIYYDFTPKMFYMNIIPSTGIVAYTYYRLITHAVSNVVDISGGIDNSSVQITEWKLFPITDTIAYSNDGISWTASAGQALSVMCYGVKYNGTRWVAVGDDPNNSIAYSSDGVNWTGVGKPDGLNVGRKVTWNGMYWVVAGEGASRMVYSSDGVNWTSAIDNEKVFTSRALAMGTNYSTAQPPTLTGTNNVSYTYGTSSGAYSGGATVALNSLVTSNSSGALTFSVSSSTPADCASVDGNTLTFSQAGVVTIGVTQAADSDYEAITTPVTFTVTLVAIAPTLTGASNVSYTYGTASENTNIYSGGSTVALNNLVTSNSGGTLSFSSSNSDPSGCASTGGTNGITLTFTQAGIVTISVTQTESGFYSAITTPVTFTVRIRKTSPSFTSSGAAIFTNVQKIFVYGQSPGSGYNGTTSVDLTQVGIGSNSDGALSYTESADLTNCGYIDTDNKTFVFTTPGTVTIQVSQNASSFYNSGNTFFDLVLNKADQTITFNALSVKIYGDSIFNLTATSSLGITVSYSSSDPAVASVSGNAVTILKAGTTTITASQDGDGNYYNAASSVQQTLTVNKADQTVTFDALNDKIYGDSSFNLTATANSGLTVSYSSSDPTVASISGNAVTILNAGTTTITASQVGDDNYNAALNVQQTLTVNKADQTVTFNTLNDKIYGDSSFNLTATASSGLTVSYSSSDPTVASVSGNVVTILKAGTTTITASQTGDGNYNAASSVQQTLTVNKIDQTVSFAQSSVTIDNVDVYTNTVALSGRATSATSGINAIQYALYNTSSDIAVINGQNILLKSPGTITLRANQNSSDNYNTSNTAEQTIIVNFAQNVSMVNNTIIYENIQPNDTVSLNGYATSSTNNPIQYVLVNTPSSVAEIQTVQSVRGLSRDIVDEQVLVIKGTGTGTIQAVQSSSTGYSTTTTTDFTSWRIIANLASSIAIDSAGLKMFRSYLYAAGGAAPQYSIDQGATWVDIPELSNGGDERFAVNADSSVIVCGSKYSTNSGATWTNYASYPNGQEEPDKLVMDNSGTKWFTMTYNLLHISTNYGQSWTQVGPTLNERWEDICMSDNGFVLMACARDGVYILTGGSWVKRAPNNIKSQSSDAFCNTIACDASGGTIYLTVMFGYLYRSEDRGKTWFIRNISSRWSRVVCSGDGKVVVAANSRSSPPYGQIWTSVDEANNWQTQSINKPNYGNLRNFTEIALSRNTGTYVLAISSVGTNPVVITKRTSAEFTTQQPQYVSYVETLPETRSVNNLSRDLLMTPEMLYISEVQYGDEISLVGFATSDTESINPIIYFADNTNCVSISATTMTILEPGTFTLKAYQASFDFYSRSNYAEKQVTITFAKSVRFLDNPIIKQYGDNPFIPAVETLLNVSYTLSLPPNNGVATTDGTTVTIIGAGLVALTVTQNVSGNVNYTSNTDTTSLAVSLLDQTITFNNINKTYLDAPFELNASSSSGLSSFTYTSSDSFIASIVGNVVTIHKAGSVQITASEAGNNNYNPANKTITLTIAKADQTLTLSDINKTYGDAAFDPGATSDSGLTYFTYSSGNSNIASASENIITIVKAGSVQITATQIGNNNYNSATKTVTLTIAKADQTITLSDINKTYGDEVFDPNASSSSGLTSFTYTSSNSSVASVSGTNITILKVGSVQLTASQAGNDNYNSTSKTVTLTIAKADQTVSFSDINKTYLNVPFDVNASSSSGLTSFTYSSSDPSIASISGNTVTILKAGSVQITASQTGDENYNPVEKTITLSIAKAEQTLTFNNINKTFLDTPFGLSASSDAGFTNFLYTSGDSSIASISGNTVTIHKAGSVQITASQSGNDNYNSASKTITLSIDKANQTLTFSDMNKKYNDVFTPVVSTSANPSYSAYTFSVPSNNGIVTTNGTSLTVIGVGTVQVTVNQATNDNFNSSTATATLTAVRATQTLTLNNMYKNELSKPFIPEVSTNAYPSYSSYTFSVPVDNGVAIMNNNIINILGMGTVQVTVIQAQNDLYESASTTATLTVISSVKRTRISLYDVATDNQHFEWSQNLDATLVEFPGIVTFREPRRNMNIEDVMSRLYRQVLLEQSIDSMDLYLETNQNKILDISSRLDIQELAIQVVDTRTDNIESNIYKANIEYDSIYMETDLFTSELKYIENRIVQRDSNTTEIETRIQQNENRESLLETLVVQTESNTTRLKNHILDTDLELVILEDEIDNLESRASQIETDIDALESRYSVLNLERTVLNGTQDSLVQHIQADTEMMTRIESRILDTDSSQTIIEHNLSLLETEMDVNDSVIGDIKGAIYAITDGNLVDHLSSLQAIAEQFNNTVNGEEDMIEFKERVSVLESIIRELTLEP